MGDEKIVFATVGTTCFDRLVETLTSKPVLYVLERLGYTKLIVQIGRGAFEPEAFRKKGFALEFYRYKDSLNQDMNEASLIISHAGINSFALTVWCVTTVGRRTTILYSKCQSSLLTQF